MNGNLYRLLLWGIAALLAWDCRQTFENSKEIAELTAHWQDVIYKLNEEDASLHQLVDQNKETLLQIMEKTKAPK